MKRIPEIKVIYEDNHLLVVEKPVNIPVQEDESGDIDMLSILKEDIKRRYNKPGNVYLGLVHRLDRPTGGVMVFAKTSKAASRLSMQVRNREFKKVYFAIVHGMPQDRIGTLKHHLLKDGSSNTVAVLSKPVEGTKEAVLDYAVLEGIMGLSLICLNLHTGRSHQIRVQLSTIGHPLYGDQKYGGKMNKPGQQLALWATEITLIHPIYHQEMTFKSFPPQIEPWTRFKVVPISE